MDTLIGSAKKGKKLAAVAQMMATGTSGLISHSTQVSLIVN
jgi:hypothetical protein